MGEFASKARIPLADSEAVIAAMCDHMLEHSVELEQGEGWRILRFPNASARFSFEGDTTLVDVSAFSLEGIYFARMIVASHILEFAGGEMPAIEWTGDGNDLSRPPNFQILQVAAVRDVSPHMRRITFSGETVGRFAGMDALHLNILIQQPGLAEPQWPGVGRDGLIEWKVPELRPHFRKYTVRSVDAVAGTLDIDFVLHADAGPGSRLAIRAKPGDLLGVAGPGGGGLVDADWYLFAGDETALPAISRMLEHLPQQARGKVLIEIADEREMQSMTFNADIDVQWLCRDGAEAGTTSLLIDAVRAVAFPDDGSRVYAWAGCEFEAFRAIRTYLRGERGLKKHENLVVSYWRRGASEADA